MTSETLFTYQRCGQGPLANMLIIGDHAGDIVPADIQLGIEPGLMTTHIAQDLGSRGIATALAQQSGCATFLATQSRLVVDLNRHRHDPDAIVENSDGQAIPGNILDSQERDIRLQRFYDPYHIVLQQHIAQDRPGFILFLHSFTPYLSQNNTLRPWHFGLMYIDDDRAARCAQPVLETAGYCVGDQLPYSGVDYDSSMRRHAQDHDIAYLGLEIRQDLLETLDNRKIITQLLLRMSHAILKGLPKAI